MNSRQALAVAIFTIFAVALVVEFTGVVDRDVATTADASDTSSEGSGELELKEYDSTTIRNAVMGGFVLFALLALIRMREDF